MVETIISNDSAVLIGASADPGTDVQTAQCPTARQDRVAVTGAGQQRPHLGLVPDVVEHDQHPPVRELGAEKRGGLVHVVTDAVRRHAEGSGEAVDHDHGRRTCL